jgi:hypothetical protein
MKVTLENWKEVERDLKASGIQDAIHDSDGYLRTIISKSGIRYELSPDVIKQLVDSGVVNVKLGRRIPNRM